MRILLTRKNIKLLQKYLHDVIKHTQKNEDFLLTKNAQEVDLNNVKEDLTNTQNNLANARQTLRNEQQRLERESKTQFHTGLCMGAFLVAWAWALFSYAKRLQRPLPSV